MEAVDEHGCESLKENKMVTQCVPRALNYDIVYTLASILQWVLGVQNSRVFAKFLKTIATLLHVSCK